MSGTASATGTNDTEGATVQANLRGERTQAKTKEPSEALNGGTVGLLDIVAALHGASVALVDTVTAPTGARHNGGRDKERNSEDKNRDASEHVENECKRRVVGLWGSNVFDLSLLYLFNMGLGAIYGNC